MQYRQFPYLFIFTCFCFSLLSNPIHAQDDSECAQGLSPKIGIFGWRICAFDIDAEAVFLCRSDDVKDMEFTQEGMMGDIILSSDQLDLGWQPGWRVTGEIFFDNCDRIELSYLSICETSDSKTVTSDTDDLYSILSMFGHNPVAGYIGTDEASLHSIKYSSQFYTWEVNYRSHLSIFEIPCFCCLDGSFIYGYRYFNLEESFKHFTESSVNEASMDYSVDTCNSMHGLQAGVEGWFPFNECLDFGFEFKAAYYFNCSDQKTKIIAEADLPEPYNEEKDKWGTTWGFEGGAKVSFEVCQNFYIRGGYLFLHLTDLALAKRNFNRRAPFEDGTRDKKIKNTGCVTYHGATIGVDLCW